MNKLFCLLICAMLFLSACSSDKGAIKDLALKLGQEKFKDIMASEADERLQRYPILRQGYLDFMTSQSEVIVEDVQMQGAQNAVAALTMNTYSSELRRVLLGIAVKVPTSKSRQFNFGEAVSLVSKQSGISDEKKVQPVVRIQFQKKQDDWIAVN